MQHLTPAELEYLSGLQKIQQQNPPDSIEWIYASKEIHAVVRGAKERQNNAKTK